MERLKELKEALTKLRKWNNVHDNIDLPFKWYLDWFNWDFLLRIGYDTTDYYIIIPEANRKSWYKYYAFIYKVYKVDNIKREEKIETYFGKTKKELYQKLRYDLKNEFHFKDADELSVISDKKLEREVELDEKDLLPDNENETKWYKNYKKDLEKAIKKEIVKIKNSSDLLKEELRWKEYVENYENLIEWLNRYFKKKKIELDHDAFNFNDEEKLTIDIYNKDISMLEAFSFKRYGLSIKKEDALKLIKELVVLDLKNQWIYDKISPNQLGFEDIS